mmetsp:Transcript_31957/g.67196  ORF Transcript_31957/g.67196 Transcript_31957/m.67196 type:complete len:239 (-) Transcript_31957:423-1139(-)
MCLDIHWAKFLHLYLLHHLSNCSRLLLIHGSLIGQSYLIQHGIRIETLGHCLLKVLQECHLISPIRHVISKHFCLFHILDADVILAEGYGGHSLLVSILAMDDGSQSLTLVLINRVPNLAHPRAGGIHNINIFRMQHCHFLKRRPECGKDHDISITNLGKVLAPLAHLLNELNIHSMQIIIHLGVMDQFIRDVDLLSREMLHGLIGKGNTALDAPAESKVLGEVYRHAILFYQKVIAF